jgi:hypothetical protein
MATKGIALREWSISRDEYHSDNEFREAVAGELASFEHIGERLGIALIAAPIRTQAQDGGTWFTAAWGFKTATVPAARAASDVTDLAPAPDELAALEGALDESEAA